MTELNRSVFFMKVCFRKKPHYNENRCNICEKKKTTKTHIILMDTIGLFMYIQHDVKLSDDKNNVHI